MAKSLDIYRTDTRLSVYRHGNGCFYLVGRVSPNEEYAKVGRESYPDTQGFIGRLWQGANTPTTVRLPEGRDEWIETQVDTYGFAADEARQLRMQTRAMTGAKLQHDAHSEAFGVLCIESDRKQTTVRATTIEQVKARPEFQSLTAILHISVASVTEAEARQGLLQARP
ncbi:hypothetical protein B1790_01965 [Mycobacterium sp. AT1]|nr:hypothetical protein B1790_01965 [Mycobacterium sp. AT1]